MPEPLIGAHMSIAGGIHKALLRGKEHGCRTIQVFTSSNMSWHTKELGEKDREQFERARLSTGIWPVVAHASYLVNLGSINRLTRRRSVRNLADDLRRCSFLGLPCLVLHPGAHGGAGTETGIMRVAELLDRAFASAQVDSVRILLETTAGSGTALGSRFEELEAIIRNAACSNRLGVCFDSAHTFAAGYDLRTEASYREVWDRFDRTLGLDRLGCFHFNDSKAEFGSRVDRHSHIGHGKMGLEPFRRILNDPRFRDIPKILETPKGRCAGKDWDDVNLDLLRSLRN